MYNPNGAFRQYCYANAAFGPNPISNFSDTLDNVSGSYADAAQQMSGASSDLRVLNLYPQAEKLVGGSTSDALFTSFTDAGKDFNGGAYDWHYRGAYSGCCSNPGWKLQLDTISLSGAGTSEIEAVMQPDPMMDLYPNPANKITTLRYTLPQSGDVAVALFDLMGRRLRTVFGGVQSQGVHTLPFDILGLHPGMYFLRLTANRHTATHRLSIAPL
ncbi:MAG: T9SS type A sorting domain-containing protein [Bacteroidetes bacterium]|nr:T9SS type A sorting domain-containing protein [Bacteroidota bacterium]